MCFAPVADQPVLPGDRFIRKWRRVTSASIHARLLSRDLLVINLIILSVFDRVLSATSSRFLTRSRPLTSRVALSETRFGFVYRSCRANCFDARGRPTILAISRSMLLVTIALSLRTLRSVLVCLELAEYVIAVPLKMGFRGCGLCPSAAVVAGWFTGAVASEREWGRQVILVSGQCDPAR